jgi:hypothetical protein
MMSYQLALQAIAELIAEAGDRTAEAGDRTAEAEP